VLVAQEEQRLLTLIYLCDCSGSMAGSRIAAVNTALAKLLPELKELAAQYPQIDIELGIISFANYASWHLRPTHLSQLVWAPLIDTGGITALGAAYRLLAAYLAANAQIQPKSLPPILILLSDGMPTDEFTANLQELLTQPLAQQALRFAVGIGNEVKLSVLQDWVQTHASHSLPVATHYAVVARSAVELRELMSEFTLSAVHALVTSQHHG
jgi:uncharacterized protein YegL